MSDDLRASLIRHVDEQLTQGGSVEHLGPDGNLWMVRREVVLDAVGRSLDMLGFDVIQEALDRVIQGET